MPGSLPKPAGVNLTKILSLRKLEEQLFHVITTAYCSRESPYDWLPACIPFSVHVKTAYQASAHDSFLTLDNCYGQSTWAFSMRSSATMQVRQLPLPAVVHSPSIGAFYFLTRPMFCVHPLYSRVQFGISLALLCWTFWISAIPRSMGQAQETNINVPWTTNLKNWWTFIYEGKRFDLLNCRADVGATLPIAWDYNVFIHREICIRVNASYK